MTFTAIFQKVPGGHIGSVEELPGANTQGETLPEARENSSAIPRHQEISNALARKICRGLGVPAPARS